MDEFLKNEIESAFKCPCPVHTRADYREVASTLRSALLITYVGDHVAVTMDLPPQNLLEALLGRITYRTFVMKVGELSIGEFEEKFPRTSDGDGDLGGRALHIKDFTDWDSLQANHDEGVDFARMEDHAE